MPSKYALSSSLPLFFSFQVKKARRYKTRQKTDIPNKNRAGFLGCMCWWFMYRFPHDGSLPPTRTTLVLRFCWDARYHRNLWGKYSSFFSSFLHLFLCIITFPTTLPGFDFSQLYYITSIWKACQIFSVFFCFPSKKKKYWANVCARPACLRTTQRSISPFNKPEYNYQGLTCQLAANLPMA